MQFKKSVMTAAIFAVGGFVIMSEANAATSDTFNVTLNVSSVCDITAGSAADIDLGTADNTVKTGTNAIEVFCSVGVPYKLALTPSNAGTTGLGVLEGPGDDIEYQLTQTIGGQAWGNEIGTNTLDSTGTGAYAAQSHGVTVKTTGSTDVAPGNYTDTVTISLTL